MIYSVSGKIMEKTLDRVVIDCNGVGYEMSVPLSVASSLPPQGADTVLYTYMNVSENDVSLFGFSDTTSRNMFLMLKGVSGVGPKAGLSILSALTPDRIAIAISGGDYKSFTAASGVGPKLAQRIVLELKDKVGKGLVENAFEPAVGGQKVQGAGQAVAALIALGYTAQQAASAVSEIDISLPVEEMIKLALKTLSVKGR